LTRWLGRSFHPKFLPCDTIGLMPRSRFLLAIAALFAAVAQTPPPAAKPKYEPPPPVQPIPYSHKKHIAAGLQCKNCHEMPDPGDFMGIPATEKCMACHITIKKESPAIQKLADYQKKGEPVPWVRVYRLAEYVDFNHKQHLASGKATCETCHGPVRERDVMRKEKDTNMAACMECHRANNVSIACDFCHELR
jgi:Cytochrome c7 and related cytochrome c